MGDNSDDSGPANKGPKRAGSPVDPQAPVHEDGASKAPSTARGTAEERSAAQRPELTNRDQRAPEDHHDEVA